MAEGQAGSQQGEDAGRLLAMAGWDDCVWWRVFLRFGAGIAAKLRVPWYETRELHRQTVRSEMKRGGQ
jgi:hypothetical protein